MRNFFKKTKPEDQDLYRPFGPEEDNQEPKAEEEPKLSISEELEGEIETYDEAINEKISDYEGLDDLIEKTIRSDYKHRREVDSMKVLREEELSDKHDRSVYAEAGFKEWALSKIPLVGKNKGRYLREGKKVYDKKELNQEEKENQTEKVVGIQEKAEMAVKEGISMNEFYALGYKKRYTETEDGLVKIIERDATESEKAGEARAIFTRGMKTWVNQGEDLIKEKEKLEKHKKDSEKFEELLNDDMISADTRDEIKEKAKEEQERLEDDIEFKEGMLRDEINSYKESFVEERKTSVERIKEFSLLVSEIKSTKKRYSEKVKNIQKNIKTAEKLQILGDAQVDLVKEFKEKLKQTEYNIEQVSLREQLIMQRLSMAKNYQSSLDGIIRDMDSIGKTRAELKQEKNTNETNENEKDEDDKDTKNNENDDESTEDEESTEEDTKNNEKDNESSEDEESTGHEKDEDKDVNNANNKSAKSVKKQNKQATTQSASDPNSPDNLVNTDEKEPEKKKVGDILERIGIKKKPEKAAARQYFKKPNQKFDSKAEIDFREAKQMYLSFLYDYRKIDDASILDDEEKKLKKYFGLKDED
jgi:hypothetical protein